MSDVTIIPLSQEYKDNYDRIFRRPLDDLNKLAEKKQEDAVDIFRKKMWKGRE